LDDAAAALAELVAQQDVAGDIARKRRTSDRYVDTPTDGTSAWATLRRRVDTSDQVGRLFQGYAARALLRRLRQIPAPGQLVTDVDGQSQWVEAPPGATAADDLYLIRCEAPRPHRPDERCGVLKLRTSRPRKDVVPTCSDSCRSRVYRHKKRHSKALT
jgi:hypothetical protein